MSDRRPGPHPDPSAAPASPRAVLSLYRAKLAVIMARPHLLEKQEIRQERDRYERIIRIYQRIVARNTAMPEAQKVGDL